VHLTGAKAGIWADFSTGQKGDALNLVRAVFGLDVHDALVWSRTWLRLDDGEAPLPARPASRQASPEPPPDPDRWRFPWQAARPIAGTLAATYLAGRKLHFDDPAGRVLRFAARHGRKNPAGAPEHHPAMLAALCDVRTSEQSGIINIYLRPDGVDRLRDAKGKTSWGRAGGAAAMLSAFDEPTHGLTICEGVETGIALLQADLAPVWALGGAGNLKVFPVLGGIEALTIAADADPPGQAAAAAVAERWCAAGREVAIIAPPAGDWAAPRKAIT
jgi:Toprim domain-containing protein